LAVCLGAFISRDDRAPPKKEKNYRLLRERGYKGISQEIPL
jgi:hypothetical protein